VLLKQQINKTQKQKEDRMAGESFIQPEFWDNGAEALCFISILFTPSDLGPEQYL
jgi:hypothetical protein